MQEAMHIFDVLGLPEQVAYYQEHFDKFVKMNVLNRTVIKGDFMNRHAVQLISRGAINKIGNMLYDYGNSVWLASMGTIGKTVLGIYQISELVSRDSRRSFLDDFRPFSRRKI